MVIAITIAIVIGGIRLCLAEIQAVLITVFSYRIEREERIVLRAALNFSFLINLKTSII